MNNIDNDRDSENSDFEEAIGNNNRKKKSNKFDLSMNSTEHTTENDDDDDEDEEESAGEQNPNTKKVYIHFEPYLNQIFKFKIIKTLTYCLIEKVKIHT